MADPKGFLTTPRVTPARRPVSVRISDWREVYTEFGAARAYYDQGLALFPSDPSTLLDSAVVTSLQSRDWHGDVTAGMAALALGMWWLHRRRSARRATAAGAGCGCGGSGCGG